MRMMSLPKFGAALVLSAAGMLTLDGGAAAQQRQPQQQQPVQQQPQRIPVVQIDQAMLDRWLVLYAEVGQQLANEQQVTEEKREAAYQKACPKAGLTDLNQCYAVDDYISALLEGLSEDGNSYSDPVALARQELARVNADKSIPAAEKAQVRQDLQARMASMPVNIPPAHFQLLTRNAKKIQDVQQRYAPKEQEPQQPAPKGQPQQQQRR